MPKCAWWEQSQEREHLQRLALRRALFSLPSQQEVAAQFVSAPPLYRLPVALANLQSPDVHSEILHTTALALSSTPTYNLLAPCVTTGSQNRPQLQYSFMEPL